MEGLFFFHDPAGCSVPPGNHFPTQEKNSSVPSMSNVTQPVLRSCQAHVVESQPKNSQNEQYWLVEKLFGTTRKPIDEDDIIKTLVWFSDIPMDAAYVSFFMRRVKKLINLLLYVLDLCALDNTATKVALDPGSYLSFKCIEDLVAKKSKDDQFAISSPAVKTKIISGFIDALKSQSKWNPEVLLMLDEDDLLDILYKPTTSCCISNTITSATTLLPMGNASSNRAKYCNYDYYVKCCLLGFRTYPDAVLSIYFTAL
jgi:hypothetical protein